jgi:2'-5' RNA ligase
LVRFRARARCVPPDIADGHPVISPEPGAPTAPTHRVFYALWPDAPARAMLARLSREIAHHAHGKATREDNLHITLAFVGAVPDDRLAVLEAIGAAASAGVAPFELALERVGGTGYGIAWLSPDGLPAPLAALHAAIAAGLAREGFAVERRMFRPHLTLARHCARAAQRGAVAPVRWTVERLALVESTLAAGGSRYRDVASWPLAAAPGGPAS